MRVASSICVLFSAAVICSGLGGCTSTIHKEARINGTSTLSIDAKQRLVLFGKRPNGNGPPVTMTCAEPSPDAIVAMSAALAAGGSAQLPTAPAAGSTTPGKNNFAGRVGFSRSESAASIAMRTATIEVLRDGYYRLCEGLMNGAITPTRYRHVVHGIGDFIATEMAIDALGGMKRAPAVAINGGVVTASADGDVGKAEVLGAQEGEDGKGQALVIGSIFASAPGDDQAEAIKKVIFAYLDHVEYMKRLEPSESEGR
jgi:hypothetical protein